MLFGFRHDEENLSDKADFIISNAKGQNIHQAPVGNARGFFGKPQENQKQGEANIYNQLGQGQGQGQMKRQKPNKTNQL